ncbi:hypothetical protein [Runella sp.]|uniref:hypothetical protein n=1 Tax=Runella sp. TaxID=1960881 RepID=UPI003D09DA4C
MEATINFAPTTQWSYKQAGDPQNTFLTRKDKKRLNEIAIEKIKVPAIIFLVISFQMYFSVNNLINKDLSKINELVLAGILLVLVLVSIYAIEHFVKMFIAIAHTLQDKIAGRKSAGIVEITSTEIINGKPLVKFVWQSGSNQKEVTIKDVLVLAELEVGDKAYLEMLPSMKEVLTFHKIVD